jgi:ribonuclease P protein component
MFRLREEGDVRRVRSRGRGVAQGPLVLKYMPNDLEPAQNRYTVIAGKRCGKAVQRNRLKRLVREALRGYHPYINSGFDIAVICRGTVEEMPSLLVAQQTLLTLLIRARLMPTENDAPKPGEPIGTGWTIPGPDEKPV